MGLRYCALFGFRTDEFQARSHEKISRLRAIIVRIVVTLNMNRLARLGGPSTGSPSRPCWLPGSNRSATARPRKSAGAHYWRPAFAGIEHRGGSPGVGDAEGR